ncbi:cold shock protein [Lucifera butyrica]|uniref:Ribonuclease R n=1 Tax=Lucifera butyrica TaxID=1351585 RepID=A0A498RB93_9FIRM|nr:ribonuclease R [Lucifera butyrica]VBB07542.1 cold shock protein [Lucifera butyrica]
MNLKQKILAFMREEAYKPLAFEDLAEEMQLGVKELSALWQALKELEANADVIKTRFDKYGLPERMNLVVGRLAIHNKGYGFVIPENPSEEGDVFVAADVMMNAMNNDRVVARIHRRQQGAGKRREGEVIRIVERANARIVGTFDHGRNFGFVIPDDSRIGQDIFIPREEFSGAKSGSKVVAEITKWPEKRKSAEGKIVEILGMPGEPGIEILSIIKKHNLPVEFPPEVEQEAVRIPQSIEPEEIAGRRDLRQLSIVTVDSEDARDLDDAVHVQRLKNGRYLLGVHIADVSYYVRENTALDEEARSRGTSVYLVDRVLPMLPPRLSNGICSLNAGEDRLTISAHMEIDHRGQVLRYEVFPSVIHVSKRLSYNIVRRILAEHDENLRAEYQELVGSLEDMERLCHILRSRRMRRGAIDFEFPEVKVKLDEQGHPLEIVKRVRSIAESIIEEFMLVANETVAEHMYNRGMPFVFRVHEEPEPEKMVKLNNLLHNFGQHLAAMDEVQPMALQKVLNRIAGRPEERIISTVMLRSLKQARYEAENLGHFGLAATYYTHFTSPIRRYPDLIVHRLIRESFTEGDVSAKRRQRLAALLPEIALHSSQRERAAAEAERETVDFKKAEYMGRFIGDEFEGIISGVTAFGFFVELDNGVEGLVHVSALDDDYYQYVEEQYALIGERTRKVFRLGEAVKVILTKVNLEERNIDFTLPEGFRPASTSVKKTKPAVMKETAKAGKRKPTEARRKRGSKTKPVKTRNK